MAFASPSTWKAWKDICSVAACQPHERTELYSVIVTNLRGALQQWQAGLPDYSDEELAQLFDEYFKLDALETGARTKDALFRRFADAPDNVEWARRLTGYIRNIARNRNSVAAYIARREGRIGPITPNISADELNEAEALLDPKVRPDELAAVADIEALASRLAPGFFATLSALHKSALWSIAMNYPVTDSRVLRLAGRGKSAIAAARKTLPETLFERLSRSYRAEDPKVIKSLALQIAQAMLPLARKWGLAGNPPS